MYNKLAGSFARIKPEQTIMPSILESQNQLHELRLAKAKSESLEKRACYINAALLATGGTVVLTFSTLMQFGPQLIMLAGLSFPPIALAAVAITGLAILSAGIYLAYCTSRPGAPIGTKTNATTPESSGCLQRLSQSACCFKLFNRSTTNVANDTSAQVNAHDGNTVTV
ncbi:MAG: hypothetical protein EBY22_07170 [Gammaproteobacteria bacterium]|nr:hypothetical protein [Gammaproteobacteria bacterium]